MKINEGMLDRGVRVVVGIALIASAVMDVFAPWGYIGVVPLVTGLVGICPAYVLFGMSTCSTSKKAD